jgi:hypothetical protein
LGAGCIFRGLHVSWRNCLPCPRSLLTATSILSPQSRTQPAAFATAILFAQEYGILAASLQDRPFVPVSTVVLEGAPRDMRAVFRRWEERPGMERAGKKASLKVVGLAAALAAIQR